MLQSHSKIGLGVFFIYLNSSMNSSASPETYKQHPSQWSDQYLHGSSNPLTCIDSLSTPQSLFNTSARLDISHTQQPKSWLSLAMMVLRHWIHHQSAQNSFKATKQQSHHNPDIKLVQLTYGNTECESIVFVSWSRERVKTFKVASNIM